MTDTFNLISKKTLADFAAVFPASNSSTVLVSEGANTTLIATGGTSGTIIRHIRVVNNTTGIVRFRIYLDDTGALATLTYNETILPPAELSDGGWTEFEGTIILNIGDKLYAVADTPNALTCTVYGLDMAP